MKIILILLNKLIYKIYKKYLLFNLLQFYLILFSNIYSFSIINIKTNKNLNLIKNVRNKNVLLNSKNLRYFYWKFETFFSLI